jgi:hypothetical protein
MDANMKNTGAPYNVTLDFSKGLQDEGNKKVFKNGSFDGICKELADCGVETFRSMIAATHESAKKQVRTTYLKQLCRPHTTTVANPESKLERAIWAYWGLHKKGSKNAQIFLPECPHVVSYQVPVYNARKSDGWGKIDILGVTPDWFPVVIELKAGDSEESPLRMIMEAVAYSIALQEAWTHPFRDNWKNVLNEKAGQSLESLAHLPDKLTSCQILGAAPPEYWKRHEELSPGWRNQIRQILFVLAERGLHISFVTLNFSAKKI